MGIDTYLVIPARQSQAEARLLRDSGEQVAHVGRDYIVLYKGDRFAEVEQAPESWGPTYARDLPASLRRGLDARGLLARPEIGQAFEASTYVEEVENGEPMLWLPVRRVRRAPAQRRLILVALSPARERLLFENPELVRELVRERAKVAIPGLIEFDERWVDLQKALFDYAWQLGFDDARSEALTPRSGMSLFEDTTVASARLVRAEHRRVLAEWLLALPPDVLARAQSHGPSPASRNFPESLGASAADDPEPLPAGSAKVARKPNGLAELEPELTRLRAFYAGLQKSDQALLSIRFHEATRGKSAP